MIEWKKIGLNNTNIVSETERAILIAMPHKSDYDGFSFWIPRKMVKIGRNKGSVELLFPSDFAFTLKKYGKGRYNRYKIIEEKVIDASDIEESFGIIDANIKAPKPEKTCEILTSRKIIKDLID